MDKSSFFPICFCLLIVFFAFILLLFFCDFVDFYLSILRINNGLGNIKLPMDTGAPKIG